MDTRSKLVLTAVVGLATLAGCLELPREGSLVLEPVDNASLANDTSYAPRTVVSGDPRHLQLVVDAIASGSATYNGSMPPRVSYTEAPASSDGRYYDVSYEVGDEWDGYLAYGRIDDDPSDPSSEHVAFESLSETDRRGLKPYLEWPNLLSNTDAYDPQYVIAYTQSELDESVLYSGGNVTTVVYEGESYEVHLDDDFREERITTYRATAAEIARSTDEFAGLMRDRYVFSFSDLTSAERSVLDDARGEYYYARSTDDEAFDAVVDEFLAHEAIVEGDATGRWLLEYRGEEYVARLHFGKFVSP